jgi:hypothetical protein
LQKVNLQKVNSRRKMLNRGGFRDPILAATRLGQEDGERLG